MDNSADTLSLSPGNYTVIFSTVGGWTSPASQTVTIVSGQATQITADYLLAGLAYTISAGAATLTGYTGPGGAISLPSSINGVPVTSISVPDTATSIGVFAFIGCPGLAAINVDPNNPAYKSVRGVFFNKTGDDLMQFPEAYAGIYGIPDGVITVRGAFGSCTGLTGITTGNINSIGNSAFSSCSSLTSITLPDSLSSIGDGAFEGCEALAGATFLGNVPSTFGASVFYDTAPSFTISYYSWNSGWSTPQWTSPSGDIYNAQPIFQVNPFSCTVVSGVPQLIRSAICWPG